MKIFYFILFFNIVISKEFECTNGHDPSTLTNKQYLKEFARGKCSPFVVVPGLSDTKLMLLIDCPVLQKENPEIFKSCGWTHCQKRNFEFWKKVPKNEYTLWWPVWNDPMAIFTPFKNSGICLANFIKLRIDFTKPLKDAIIKAKGYQVRIFGNTDSTRKISQCGDEALCDLSIIPFTNLKFWGVFYDKVKLMGYKRGLTYQSLPYDWRRSYKHNRIKEIFEPNLERMNRLTKKKVVLFGHSHGVRIIYYRLLKMSQKKKDKYVKAFVSVGGNFMGSSFENLLMISGFQIKLLNLGLSYKASVELFNGILSSYETRTVDPFGLYEGEEWFENIKKRMDYEVGKVSYEESGFDILPSMKDNCSSNENSFDSACVMGFFDSRKYPSIVINDKKYFKKDLDKIPEEYAATDREKNFIKITKDDEFNQLINPGVPFIPFVLRTYPTPAIYIWKKDIKEDLKNSKFHDPEKTINSYGDQTVDTTSLLMAPLKWAYEFDNKKNPNAKPVKIIDVCSEYNEKYTIYDKYKPNSEYEFTKNEFIGMNCDSFNEEVPSKSTHSVMITDTYFMRLCANVLKSNERTYDKAYGRFVDELDEEGLLQMTLDECPQVQYFYEDFN